MSTSSAPSDDPDELPPPWAKYPEIPWGSIGWRWGSGERWIIEWHEWLARQPRDREQRVAYLRRHPVAPRPWARVVSSVLERVRVDEANESGKPESGDALATRLAAEGLVGDDVGMGAWAAIHGDAPQAPWAVGVDAPADTARTCSRELTFWARWCADRRTRGQLDAWLQSVPAPGPAWEPVRDAVRSGVPPEGWHPESAWGRLAVLVSAHTEAPPPWVLGEVPAAFAEELEDDCSYADAWSLWVAETIDDGASWRAYLERYEGVPAEWRELIAREIWIGG
jgi:hypothetical protein